MMAHERKDPAITVAFLAIAFGESRILNHRDWSGSSQQRRITDHSHDQTDARKEAALTHLQNPSDTLEESNLFILVLGGASTNFSEIPIGHRPAET
jgi:hypothetical protein